MNGFFCLHPYRKDSTVRARNQTLRQRERQIARRRRSYERRYEAGVRRHINAYHRRQRVKWILLNPNFWGWVGATCVGLLLVFLVAAPFFAK